MIIREFRERKQVRKGEEINDHYSRFYLVLLVYLVFTVLIFSLKNFYSMPQSQGGCP